MGGSAPGSSRRPPSDRLTLIKCMFFDPETGNLETASHVREELTCRFVHPSDGKLWDIAKISNRRRDFLDRRQKPDRSDPRDRRPSHTDHYEHRKPDGGYPGRDSYRRRSPSPGPRRPSLSDRDFNPSRVPSGWSRSASSSLSLAKPASPVRSDRTNGTSNITRIGSPSGRGNGGASVDTSGSLPAAIQSSDLKGSTSKEPTKLWLPIAKTPDSQITSPPTAMTSAPAQLPSRKLTLDTASVEKSGRMDIDSPLFSSPLSTNGHQPPPSVVNTTDDKEASIISLMKLLVQMSEVSSRVGRRDQEITEIKRLVSHSSMTVSPHPRIARLEKDNEEDAACLRMLASQAAEGPNLMRNFAQSSMVAKGVYQSRADLLASVEKLEADMRDLTEQQKPSLSKPGEPQSDTTGVSKKRKQPGSSAVSSRSTSLATSQALRRLEHDLDNVREEVIEAKGAIAGWAEDFSEDMEERFDMLIAKKSKTKSTLATRKRSAIQETQDKYERERAEDRAKIAQFMAEAAVLDDNHQQLKKEHEGRTDRMAKLEDEVQALLHALHAYQQSRSQFDTSSPTLQTRVHALFDEIAKSTLDTIRSELESKLEAVVTQADEAAVKRNKATFASVLANLQPTVQLNQLIQDWITQADRDSVRQALPQPPPVTTTT